MKNGKITIYDRIILPSERIITFVIIWKMYIRYMKLFTRNLNCAKHAKHAKRFSAYCPGACEAASITFISGECQRPLVRSLRSEREEATSVNSSPAAYSFWPYLTLWTIRKIQRVRVELRSKSKPCRTQTLPCPWMACAHMISRCHLVKREILDSSPRLRHSSEATPKRHTGLCLHCISSFTWWRLF